jgi:hypothetical protein
MALPVSFDTENISLKVIDGKVIHTYIKDFKDGKLQDVLEIHQFLNTHYSSNSELVNLLEFGNGATIDREVREYLASHDRMIYSKKIALLVRNLSQRFVGSYFLKFNNPKLPAKVFYEEQEAIDWLLED